jgi:hypothetical protein
MKQVYIRSKELKPIYNSVQSLIVKRKFVGLEDCVGVRYIITPSAGSYGPNAVILFTTARGPCFYSMNDISDKKFYAFSSMVSLLKWVSDSSREYIHPGADRVYVGDKEEVSGTVFDSINKLRSEMDFVGVTDDTTTVRYILLDDGNTGCLPSGHTVTFEEGSNLSLYTFDNDRELLEWVLWSKI